MSCDETFSGIPKQAEKIMELMTRMKRVQIWEICPELNPTEVMLLHCLCSPGREKLAIPLKTLTEQMHMLPASLSRVMKNMEEQDLICRTIDPYNRRNIRVQLTDKGLEYALICRKRIKKYWEEVFVKIPQEDWDSLLRIMGEFTDAMESVLKVYTENAD